MGRLAEAFDPPGRFQFRHTDQAPFDQETFSGISFS
jgi:hypothetical protein